jgi:HSP20 family protein
MALPTLRTPTAQRPTDRAGEFQELYDRLGQWMTSLFEDPNELLRTWLPLADVVETPDTYLIDVDLPGVKRDDISIELEGNELTISGELNEKQREGLFRRRMRRVGRFEYRATLPRDAKTDENAVDAELNDGVLTVKIPKDAAAKPRRIAITGK